MSTEPCDRCGDPAPEPLLRDVQLLVDGAGVDEQTLCPDCFSDWIARYRDEMAGNMPGQASDSAPDSVGGDIRVAEEEPQSPGVDTESNVLSQAVDAAQEQAESEGQSSADGQTSGGGGDEIRELGDGSAGTTSEQKSTDSEIEIDLNVGDDEDGGGLL